MNVISTEFEQELEQNLSTYTTISPDHFHSDANLFSTRKEIAIARYALSSQALAYKAAMEILLDILDRQRSIGVADDNLMRNIQTLLAGIEQKSAALIDSVKKVTELLGKAIEIDVDKAALRTLLINAPSILEKTITQVSGDSSLASTISKSFNCKINELMIMFRLNRDESLLPAGNGNAEQNGISMLEYQQLMNTVPGQPELL